MGVKKGTDNFEKSRTEREHKSATLIHQELNKLRKIKSRFRNMSSLVQEISFKTGLHRTTLTRNNRYFILLNDFLRSQPGASKFLDDAVSTTQVLQSKLIDARMEIGQLKSAATIATVLDGKNKMGPKGCVISESQAHSAFFDTVMVLRLVLEQMNSSGEIFQIDFDQCEIRDLSAAPGRQVIVSGRRLKSFMDAYSILLVQEGLRKSS